MFHRRNFSDIRLFSRRALLFFAIFLSIAMGYAIVGVDEAFGADSAGYDKLVDFVFRLINFAVLAGFLFYFGARKVKDFFAGRNIQVVKSIDDANQALEEAEARYREVMIKLAAATEEIAELTKSIELQGSRERDRIMEEAEASAQRIRKDVQDKMDQSLADARLQLRTEAVDLAVTLAEKLLLERITPEDQKNIVIEIASMIGHQESFAKPIGKD